MEVLVTFLFFDYSDIKVSTKSAIHRYPKKCPVWSFSDPYFFVFEPKKLFCLGSLYTVEWSDFSFFSRFPEKSSLYTKLAITTEPKIKLTCNFNRRFN